LECLSLEEFIFKVGRPALRPPRYLRDAPEAWGQASLPLNGFEVPVPGRILNGFEVPVPGRICPWKDSINGRNQYELDKVEFLEITNKLLADSLIDVTDQLIGHLNQKLKTT
jgi:hypothetical protein